MKENDNYHGLFWTILDKSNKRWGYLDHPDRGGVLGFTTEAEAWDWAVNSPKFDPTKTYEVLDRMPTLESDAPFGDSMLSHSDLYIRRSSRWIVVENTPANLNET